MMRAKSKDQGNSAQIGKMRIGFIIPWITKSQGGTENVGQMMANAMAGRGHEVVIFTFENKEDAPSRWPLADNITLLRLSEASGDLEDQLMTIEVASQNLDLLVGLHMNRTFMRYVRCAQKLGLPLVLSEHIDPRFPAWIGTFDSDERVFSFSGATRIHMLLEQFRTSLPPYLQDRIKVIANTIREPQTLSKPTAADGGSKTLLTVSRLVPRKHIGHVIRAFGQLAGDFPDWKLCVVGDGSELAALQALVDDLKIGDVVDFAGAQTDPYPFYVNADIFALPSVFEGFPLTLCEALAHGVPSIGYQLCDGAAAQIIDGENGFLAQGDHDPDALVPLLRKLMEDDALRTRMSDAALTSYRERFSNAVIHGAWEALFAEALAAGPVQPGTSQKQISETHLQDFVWKPAQLTSK